MLRETLESNKEKELALQKEKKTLILSLDVYKRQEETVSEEKSHDTYKIYQLKSDDELWQYHFENLESLKAHDLKVRLSGT